MTDTEKPRTVSLDRAEWQQLVVLNSARLTQYLQSIEVPTDLDMASIEQHVGRMRSLMLGWQKAPPPAGARPAQATAAAPEQPHAPPAATNGTEPKRKGGWPRGKPRKPAQTAAQH